MTYPPQQPENGWSNQPDQSADAYGSGGADQAGQYGAQQHQGQAPQYQEPETDQTQAIQVQPHANPYQQQYQQPQGQAYQDGQQIPQQPADPYQQYQQPAEQQAYDPFQQQQADPYQAQQQGGYQQANPYQQQQQADPYQAQQPADPYQQYQQPAEQQAYDPFQQQADPYQAQQQGGYQQANPYQQQDPYQQQQQADPFQQQQQADPYQAQQQGGYQQANPYQQQDPYQQQQPANEQPQAQQQPFGPPNVYQPAEPETRPVNFGQTDAPTSASPSSAQPYSASPVSGPTSGVPESPFAAAPTPKHLPAPVSASPTSGEPWGSNQIPQFTPKQKPSRGVPGWAYIVGAVVIVLALAAGGAFYFGVFDSEEKPTADKSQSTEEETKHEPKPVTDSESGLTYMSMPEPWTSFSDIEGFPGVSGFASETGQSYVDDSGDLGSLGVIAVGQLDSSAVDYKNVDSLASSTESWADVIDAKHWKNPADEEKVLKVERDETLELANLRVDGRRAVTGSYHVTWKSKSTNETGASVYLVVIDQGDGHASGFMTVVPDSLAADQSKVAEDAMLSLQYE